ncbi:hypothetical protein M0L20_22180 [Spirosoma sp. RP8]|uniref:Uncharacterized protein n=1 Tax=Spirosoma liriopis TaxID=2937440 RepID=A0ABT0HQY7_9BACT|nr:hypothetical protein [Spirosoma liriopis]MCK8494593.1 hypothetical protein [Spirosoma liriopis]
MAIFTRRLLGVLCLWATFLPVLWASPDPTDDHPPVPAKPNWGSGQSEVAPALALAIAETKIRLAARTAYLQTEAQQYGAVVSQAAQAERDTAAGLFSFLDSRGGFVDSLRGSDLMVLPVGIRKTLGSGNGTLDIGILKVRFLADRALLTVYVRLKIPSPDPYSNEKKRELLFGADNVPFSRDGGLAGDFKLTLLGDFVQPLGNMTLRFKGGLNRFTGATEDITYANVSCQQLAGLRVVGDVLFAKSMLTPIDANTGTELPGQVSATFRIHAPDFNDLLADLEFQQAFAITKYPKFGFKLVGASLDLSDKHNSDNVKFPAGYFDNPQNQLPDDSPDHLTWRGVYIKEFGLILPKEFKPADNANRLTIKAFDLLIDRQGVSGRVGMHIPSDSAYAMTASGWAMSLNDFELNFEKSRLIGGAFGGFLKLPIAPDTPIRYDGYIDDTDNYRLRLANVSTLAISMWRAEADLLPNSTVELNVIAGQFKPKAILYGKLGIYTNVSGAQKTKSDALFKFEGINFSGLVLQTEPPYVQAASFGYEGDVKLAGFPVTIHGINAVFEGNSTVGLGLNMEVNLMEGSFGAQTAFTVLGEIQTGTVHRWSFKRVELSDVCVSGTSSLFKLKGCVGIFEDEANGTGFRGSLSFGMAKPAKVQITAVATFGRKSSPEEFRYWYVTGGSTVPNIPLVGPLQINYVYAGAYNRMRPSSSGTIAYEPDNTMGLGFKGGIGLVAVSNELFQGAAGFEILFNRNGGLNSVGLYGDCAFTGGRTDKSNDNLFFATKQSYLYSKPYKAVETFDNAELDRKAKEEYRAASSPSKAPLYARLVLLYDNQNSIFKGTSDAYVNIANIVYGGGPNKRLGLIDLYFDPTQWHIYLGTIAQPFDLTIDFGVKASARAYMMVGHGIPEMPLPPVEVRNVVGDELRQKRTPTEKQSLFDGKGLAFGASMNVKIGGCAFVGCIEAQALAGFDIMLKHNQNSNCDGVNGWYSNGQIYALANAELSLFGVPLVSADVAVLLEGGLPNPSWFQGRLGARVRVFGIPKKVSFNIKAGNICRL